MGWMRIEIIAKDGRRTIEEIGKDPLRDDAPKGQVEQDIENYERWAVGDGYRGAKN